MRNILATALLALVVSSFLAPASAHAAEEIVIVDMQRILQESTAAKDIRTKIKQKRDDYQAEITKQEESLRKVEQKLGEQRAILSPEAFEAKSKEFKEQLMDVQRGVQEKRSKLDAALNESLEKIQVAVLEIITALSKEKGFKLAIPSSQVLFATTALDVTEDVLTRLNKKLPNIKISIQ